MGKHAIGVAVSDAIRERDFAALVRQFDADPYRTRRVLKQLACAPDDPDHGYVVAAFRVLSSERSAKMPEFFLETMRRSLWEMNEEGGNVAWSAPEIVAAVVAGAPDRFGSFASYLVMAALGEPTFRPSLRAAVRLLDEVDSSLLREHREDLENAGVLLPSEDSRKAALPFGAAR
ncbi:hypothetical protein [Rubneribacter badeniensis]|uniref:hypothetical protein n=1 Tax=Rubneribacter badeniensis TaxID=2070688 RepID=UPI003A928D50